MLLAPDRRDQITASYLGRTSPLVKLGVAIAWLIGLTLTLDPRPAVRALDRAAPSAPGGSHR